MIVLISMLIFQGILAHGDWKPAVVETKYWLDEDLRDTPLQIKTNSSTGSGDEMNVIFFDSLGGISGVVILNFNEQIEYKLPFCTFDPKPLSNVPLEENKIWTIQRTTDGIKIECNEQIVLDYNVEHCPNEPCLPGTYESADKITCEKCGEGSISTENDAAFCTPCSLGYQSNGDKTLCVVCKAGTYRDRTVTSCTTCPENSITDQDGAVSCSSCIAGLFSNLNRTSCVSCDSLPESWTAMTAETELPVPQGSEVYLGCETGHTLTGDEAVTCKQGSEFSYTHNPACQIDKCNNLPDGENLRTTVNFPVSYNTPVTVTCNVGYSPEGEHVITCVKGEEFQGRLPSCKCKSAVDSDI
ncbi:hypothetical protein ACHWQZ_G006373 [Mnemiopsis leidyi]